MRATALDGFIRQTIQDNPVTTVASSAEFAERIRNMLRSDYRAVLRRFFVRDEVRELIAAGERSWPRLNRQPLRDGSLRSYVKQSAARGITMVLGREQSAKTLLGFYLPKTPGLPKPLIWLNAAVRHRAIRGATFAHEMGHHIAGEVLGQDARFHSAIHARLDNRYEVAADMFVSLAGIPRAAAQTMFRQRGENVEHLRRSHRRMCGRYGIALGTRAGEEDLTCLLGSLHYLKLRAALLSEFGL